MWQTRKWAGVATIAAVLTIGVGLGWANWPDGPQQQPEVAAALPTAPAPQAKDDPRTPAEAWPFARRTSHYAGTLLGVAPDGRTLLFNRHAEVFGHDLTEKTGTRLTFRIHSQNAINDAAVSSDGKYIATAEGIDGVKLRDSATGKVLEAFWPSGKLPAQQVAFTPDGTRLVALGTTSGRDSMPGKGPGGKGASFFKDPDAKVTFQAQVSVWDMATRKELGHPVETTTVSRIVQKGPSSPEYQLGENGRFVLRTEYVLAERKADPDDPTGRLPRSGERAGFRFTIIDAVTGKAEQPVEVKDPKLLMSRPHTISPDGKSIVVSDASNLYELRLLDTATGKERVRFSPLLRPIKPFIFSPDGRYFAAASGRDGTGANAQLAAPSEVVIWDAATGKELARLSDKESIRDYTALRFSPDGSFIVAQDGDSAFTIWGHPPKPKPEPVKPTAKAKEPPTPPSGVPNRFQTLFQSLSSDDVTDQRRIEGVFLAALGRLPTDVESRTLAAQFARQTDKPAALRDLLNTLVGTDEFKAHAEALGKLSK